MRKGGPIENSQHNDIILLLEVYIKLILCSYFATLYSVPGVTIATDIICGFPTETAEVGGHASCSCI